MGELFANAGDWMPVIGGIIIIFIGLIQLFRGHPETAYMTTIGVGVVLGMIGILQLLGYLGGG